MIVKIEDALKMDKTVFVDVRTEAEYTEDHILNAVSIPLFNDEERKDVGTIYKMLGKRDAVQKGFDYVSYKLKDIYNGLLDLAQQYENIVVYCARGGMRSGSITNLISTLGMNIYQLEGGYKAYRNFVLDYFKVVMDAKNLISVHGLTGVGKTDLLKALDKEGADVLDLEGLAKHSGSIFGNITFDENSPNQKMFESEVFKVLYFSEENYIFVESESKKIGQNFVPTEIYEGMTNGEHHIILECSVKNRVNRLCYDYIYSKQEKNIKELKECINKFRKRLGNKSVDEYIELLDTKKYEKLVENYLKDYYDPLYQHSIDKYNYEKTINYDNEKSALKEVLDYYNSLIASKNL